MGATAQPESRRAWVFSVAHNVLRDEYRAARREPLPGDARDERAAAETAPEWRLAIRDAVGAALRALPAEQRHVILLRLFDDLSFAQIGRRLGVPEGTARTRAFHGLRRLRAAVAARLRQGGWLVECGIVRQRLLQIAFGLSADRAGEEVRRHLAACAECRQEAAVVGAMLQGVAATAQSAVMVAGWAMHDMEGNATSYWVNEQVNFGDTPQSEWGCNSGFAPDQWTWFDAAGRRLEVLRQWRQEDGRHGMRVRLHEPWLPGAVFHAVGALPMRLRVRPADAAWEVWWSECPLSAEAQGVTEVICRRALQLPRGYRVRDCEPEPDHHFANGALLTWSMVVPKGEHLNLRVVCVAQG